LSALTRDLNVCRLQVFEPLQLRGGMPPTSLTLILPLLTRRLSCTMGPLFDFKMNGEYIPSIAFVMQIKNFGFAPVSLSERVGAFMLCS
jgi:hypothetical protein